MNFSIMLLFISIININLIYIDVDMIMLTNYIVELYKNLTSRPDSQIIVIEQIYLLWFSVEL